MSSKSSRFLILHQIHKIPNSVQNFYRKLYKSILTFMYNLKFFLEAPMSMLISPRLSNSFFSRHFFSHLLMCFYFTLFHTSLTYFTPFHTSFISIHALQNLQRSPFSVLSINRAHTHLSFI